MKELRCIAKKEIMDNIRNKWIIFSSGILVLLLLTSFFLMPSLKYCADFKEAISQLAKLVSPIVPIIALILGYASIAREIESGTMEALVAMPISRREITAGKFLGLLAVLVISIFLSFGVSAMVITFSRTMENFSYFFLFMLCTILLGSSFLALSFFFSSLLRKRSSALILAIFIWFFFNLIMPLIQTGLLLEVGMEGALAGKIPDWLYALDFLNPLSMYTSLVDMLAGSAKNLPSFYTPYSLVAVFLIWILLFFLLTVLKFERTDI